MVTKKTAFLALRWTAVGVVIKSIIQFCQMIALARLLGPSNIGLLALIMQITIFLSLFIDMGVNNAIVHHPVISESERSSLYWLTVMVGSFLSLLFAASAPCIANFYNEQHLTLTIWIISPCFLITALSQQLRVFAEKSLDFESIIKIEIFTTISGFLLTIGMVGFYPNVNSVALGYLITALLNTVLIWMYLSQGWFPMRRFSYIEIRKYIKFGVYVIVNNIVSTVIGSFDILMGGKILGVSNLGSFGLPRDLTLNISTIINSIATRVGFPLMSKYHSDTDELRKIYFMTLRATASINTPIFTFLFLFSSEIVTCFFGAKWSDSVELLRILAIWGGFRSYAQPVGSLLYACGKADLALKWNLGWILIVVPVFWLGMIFGTQGLAWSMACLMIFGQIPHWWFLIHPLCKARFFEYFIHILIPLFTSILTAFIIWRLVESLNDLWMRLGIGLSTGLILYIALSYIFNKKWFHLMLEFAGGIKMKKKK